MGQAFIMPDFGELWTPTPVTLKNGWLVDEVAVGPELAEAMLGYNAPNQRAMSNASVARFCEDMANGRWRLTHQGIAFDRIGRLVDGQNRLWAVSECQRLATDSAITVPMLVFFGVGGAEEMVVFDTGKHRTAIDAARVAGLDVHRGTIPTINAAVRYGRKGRSYHLARMTQTATVELVERYRERANSVCHWFGTLRMAGVNSATVRGAVLTALVNDVPEDVCHRAVSVMLDTVPATEAADQGPKLLRQYVVNSKKAVGSMASADLFLRTTAAIKYAHEGRGINTLRAPDESPYTMPENR